MSALVTDEQLHDWSSRISHVRGEALACLTQGGQPTRAASVSDEMLMSVAKDLAAAVSTLSALSVLCEPVAPQAEAKDSDATVLVSPDELDIDPIDAISVEPPLNLDESIDEESEGADEASVEDAVDEDAADNEEASDADESMDGKKAENASETDTADDTAKKGAQKVKSEDLPEGELAQKSVFDEVVQVAIEQPGIDSTTVMPRAATESKKRSRGLFGRKNVKKR